VIKHGFVKGLGIVMTIALASAIVIRLIAWRHGRTTGSPLTPLASTGVAS
jgi:hypothetical protein